MRTSVSLPSFLAASALTCVLAVPTLKSFAREDYFTPKHRLTAIGASRPELDAETLAARSKRMIEAETFTILRDPHALEGVRRIVAPHLQQVFKQAADQS